MTNIYDISVSPKVFLVGEPTAHLSKFVNSNNYHAWAVPEVAAEALIEAAGKTCYKSWFPRLNKNVERTRQGPEYIQNLIDQGHGSVFEHISLSFILQDVSRVLTHELVRHRAGCAYSQESLRYVRLDKMKIYLPKCIKGNPKALKIFCNAVRYAQRANKQLWDIFEKEPDCKSRVKEISSAVRRIAPDGIATNIFFTANVRALRHIIELRTSLGAEEEIRAVFFEIAKICKDRFPVLFKDLRMNRMTGCCTFKKRKI